MVFTGNDVGSIVAGALELVLAAIAVRALAVRWRRISGLGDMTAAKTAMNNNSPYISPSGAEHKRRTIHGPFHVVVTLCMTVRAVFHFGQPLYYRQDNYENEIYPYSLWVCLIALGNLFYELAYVFLLVYLLLLYYDLRDLQLSAKANNKRQTLARIRAFSVTFFVIFAGSLVVMSAVFWENQNGMVDWIDFGAVIIGAAVSILLSSGFAVFGGKLFLLYSRLRVRSDRMRRRFQRVIWITGFVAVTLVCRAAFDLTVVSVLFQTCWDTKEHLVCDRTRSWLFPWQSMIAYYFILEWFPFAITMWLLRKGARPTNSEQAVLRPLLS